MESLRRELGDPGAASCGRCDSCTGRGWPAGVSQAGTEAARAEAGRVEAARARLLRAGVGVEPGKMWPSGMKDLGGDGASGKIPAGLLAETGRALGRLSDIGWGTTLRGLLAPGAPDAPATDQVIDAVINVLAAWSWDERPTRVVTLPSVSRPVLIASLGPRTAHLGRVAYLAAQ